MSWRLVARKDFADAGRSRMLWGIVGVSVALILVIVLAFGAGSEDATATDVMALYAGLGGQLVIPVVALVVGYRSVVGERQSGSIRFLHGLPHSRRDIVVGKLVGRSTVIALATLVAFAVGGVTILGLFGSLPLGPFVAFTVLTTLLGVTFTAIAVGVSAATATRGSAMGWAIGGYLVLMLFWEPVAAGVHLLLTGGLAGYRAPAWYFLFKRLSPGFAYLGGVNAQIDGQVAPLIGWSSVVESIPEERLAEEGALAVSNRVAGDLPFYLHDWFAAVILVAWVVAAAAVGYRRFVRADLT